MSFEIISLITLYIFLSALLLLFIIGAKLWWQVKAVVIVASLFFFVTSYQTIDGLLGRPTTIAPQPEVLYIAAIVKPPNKLLDDPGEIVIWVKDLEGYRLHKFDYTKNLHKKVTEARRIKQRGGMVRMATKKKARRGSIYDDVYEIEMIEKRDHLPPKPLPDQVQDAVPGIGFVPVPGARQDNDPGDQNPWPTNDNNTGM